MVMKGLNDDELLDFVRLTEQLPIVVRFIEYMPFSGNRWNVAKFVAYRDMLAEIMGVWPHLTKLQDGENDTTKVRGHLYDNHCVPSLMLHRVTRCQGLLVV